MKKTSAKKTKKPTKKPLNKTLFQSQVMAVYAVLMALGGAVGFLIRGSFPSLVAGLGFSALLALSSWLIHKKAASGFPLAMVLTITLTLFFTYRFCISYAFFPAGLMTIVSLFVLTLLNKR